MCTSPSSSWIGEISRPCSVTSGAAEIGDRRPNSARADRADHGECAGEVDLAPLLLAKRAGEVFKRGDALGVGGGARGDKYLSAGFIVLISGPIAPTDALLCLKGLFSIGTHR